MRRLPRQRRRIGRFDDNGKPVEIKPHNASMMALGLFVLWFGFIPFNAGSGVSMLGWMAGQTGRIAVMTTMGGYSGGCSSAESLGRTGNF